MKLASNEYYYIAKDNTIKKATMQYKSKKINLLTNEYGHTLLIESYKLYKKKSVVLEYLRKRGD